MNILPRFLNYVSYWTTSQESAGTTPSTSRQFDLARVLEQELISLGVKDVVLDEFCYVYGYLPATEGYPSRKSIGLISHMDTAPDMSGKDVKPNIIENYDGTDIILPNGKVSILVSDFPRLKSLKGKTLITADGNTLLGADDKAGIAEIITAVEEILKRNLPHPDIYIAFTPDEEIGEGSDHFDLNRFQADFAYTVDGDYEGEIAYENFNAASAEFTLKGKNVHPGEAKNIMVNAASIACEIQSLLPEHETPEHTEGREGFYHLTNISGDIGQAKLSYIVRDHNGDLFQKKLDYLEKVKEFISGKYGKDTVTLSIQESYRNMVEIIDNHMEIIRLAEEAITSVGLTPVSTPVRGGTDGARISFMGIPCPNLGTGGYGFHGPMEHIALESMETVVEIICHIVSHVN
ncbi:MAG: peptidase T [Lachnospiraceae bacterium]|jgi:peptidase T|uniref:peptidase T n=1 Tax=Roseburia sp. 1XD42-69 TaxID=2320088 RepID=UPI000EA3F920|nr:peptidase T [Roseburia sp. 1XD42-69]MCI8875413.1 peptidase T [Lachnospiraceae bacterium]RKJ63516.1 peptidase T [Roseburia sp. 1XD42-69]